jgi:hypothetical protein
MASNNTIVISFSIALFLLLLLLLLVTYNSKCQMDNVEKFMGQDIVENIQNDKKFVKSESIASRAQSNTFSVDNTIGENAPFFADQVSASNPNGNAYNKPVQTSTFTNTAQEARQAVVTPQDSGTGGTGGTGGAGSGQNGVENNVACFPRERLTSDDLLPSDANSKWAKVNPISSGEIGDQNFLTAGYHIGISTSVGRNNSLDLRHEPLAPQIPVSPWGISTIVPQPKTNGLYDIGSAMTSE